VTRFAAITVQGLALGSIYTLIAIGWVVIYRATQVLSFAQPGLMIAGAYCTIYFRTVMGLNFAVAVALAVVITAILGGLSERVALRWMVGQPVFAAVMVTIGLDVFLRVNVNALLGAQPRRMGDPWGLDRVSVGQFAFFQSHLATIAVTVVVVAALLLFLKRSKYGLGMRSTSLDQEAAQAQGIPVGRMFNLAWVIAGVLAAIAGTFVGAGGTPITPATWVIGGAIIGLVEAYVAAYQPGYAPWLGRNFSLVAPYVVMLLVLLVRPYGLYGTPEVERV
jgi:branched-chain amino acid transport system permease protein